MPYTLYRKQARSGRIKDVTDSQLVNNVELTLMQLIVQCQKKEIISKARQSCDTIKKSVLNSQTYPF